MEINPGVALDYGRVLADLRKRRDELDIAIAMIEKIMRLPKDPAAVELGRRGGLKGGKARAKKLSPRKRSQIAKKAAKARWRKTK